MTALQRPEDMTREDLELGICVELSIHEWHDVTEIKHDPEAVRTLGMGVKGKSLWMMSRYEDGEFALVCTKGEGKTVKRVDMEQYKLEWLWEQVSGKGTA
jgi:hypothetical protein